jgi:preprotein translocase subunit SecF
VNVSTIDTQIIGPSWGKEITRKALYGLFGFLFVVMVYLAMALEPKMAVAAIVAVVHDVFITVGIYALVGFDVTPATIIGFLTILGYSLYDTVVVFDKVRENTKSITSTSTKTYSQAVNLAVNQTIVRSANTSIVALLPVASILFVGAGLLGAGTLKDLSLALFIGLIVGTYSSIFIAPPVLAQMREREPAMQALAKRVSARSGGTVVASTVGAVAAINGRGPRNQPKRKGRK